MKLAFLFAGSVSLNVALGIGCLLKTTPLATPTIRTEQETPGPPIRTQVVEQTVTNVVTVIKSADPFDWRMVESEDYKQYVANLRAIGCPEKTLRDIIMADVTDLFRQRARSSLSNRVEYWRPGVLGNAFDEQRVARQQEQAKERRQILATLLGDSYSDKSDPAAGQIFSPLEQLTGDFLTPEKQAAMKAMEMKYAGRMLQAAKDGGGDDSRAMREVMTEKDAEMLKLLSPEEKFEYELRLSQPAIMLRMNLGKFEPTEAEFRDMYSAAKNSTDRFGLGVLMRLGNPHPGDGAVNETMDGFRAVLTPQRFQEFQKQLAMTSR